MFFNEDPPRKKRRGERVGFAPFDALLEKVQTERVGSWRSIEAEFLTAVTAFDTEYSAGAHDTGWYQLKGRFFNDLIVDLVENCAGREIARRAKRPDTLFAAIDLDICFPVEAQSAPIVAGESKIAGTADAAGPDAAWVELAHVVLDDIPAETIPGWNPESWEVLASELRELTDAERRERFESLIAAARARAERSGNLGYFVREQLRPELADAAFGSEVMPGAVLGPIVTEHGPELFLVLGQHKGPLDERAINALLELRNGTAPEALSATLSPSSAARAVAGPWRAEIEFASSSPAHAAFFGTALGSRSSVVRIDEELVSLEVIGREMRLPDANALGRLAITGFSSWIDNEAARVGVTVTATSTPPPEFPSEPVKSNVPLPTMLSLGTPRGPQAP